MRERARNGWLALAWLVTVTVWTTVVAAEGQPPPGRPVAARHDDGPSPPSAASPSAPPARAEAADTPTSEQIATWVADLDDNRYLVREAATRRLFESGAAALDHLLAAANGDRPEPADRALWILRRLGNGKDQLLRRQALERLVHLQHRPQIAAAAREALGEIRHNEAVEAIQRLGGRYVTTEYGMVIGPYYTPRVVLDSQWRGGDAGLEHIRNLVAAQQVIIIGTEVSAEGLAHLQKVNMLRSLLLYGTKLEPEQLPNLQKLLPQVEIDYRRGALLGVGSDPQNDAGPAVVSVVSKGSVAEAAGIQVGDVIRTFENQPVANFKALTLMIGKHRAGDEVSLEVVRGGQPIEFKLKLGAWETIN